MIVLDASAVVELVLRTPRGARLAMRLAATDDTLHAPHLLDIEVAQVIRRYELHGALTPAEGLAAIADLDALDIARYPHDVLLPRIWALRGNLTAYDAAYVALAEALGASLATCDARLARAPGLRASIDLIP